MQSIISIKQFYKQEKLNNILNARLGSLKGKILATLFFEPSTRTRLSFESAMLQLGGNVISVENGNDNSSSKKGESLHDMIKSVESYADCIVVRHPESGILERCQTKIPLINAGDGINEHPSQNLTDYYTITKHIPDLNGKNIVFTGDLLCSRTIHGLASLIINYFDDANIYFVVGEAYTDVVRRITIPKFELIYERDIGDVLGIADVLYMTRHQFERESKSSSRFILKKDFLPALKEYCIIMHPLPRGNEISPEIDCDHRAVYFEQAKNGLQIRKAILYSLMGNLSE